MVVTFGPPVPARPASHYDCGVNDPSTSPSDSEGTDLKTFAKNAVRPHRCHLTPAPSARLHHQTATFTSRMVPHSPSDFASVLIDFAIQMSGG